MKLLRIKAIAKKELIQIRRDRLSLGMAFVMPALLLVIFGYAITLDVNRLATAVYDRDRSSISRDFVHSLAASGYFTIVRYAQSGGDIDNLLDSGTVRVVLSIPEDFSNNIRAGRTAPLQVIVDGSDSNTATIALGYAMAFASRYAASLSSAGRAPLVEPMSRVWYNSGLKSRNFIIPGLIAVIMVVIAALLTSLTVAREWERGTMEQLISTPVKPSELILGKLLPHFMIGGIDVALAVTMAVGLFDVPFRGSLLLLAVLSGIFLFGGLSLGVLISVTAKSQLVASQISLVSTFLPAFLLSGFLFAITNMPEPLQLLTRIIPARYYVTVVKDIFLKGSQAALLVTEILFLSLFGVLVFALAVKNFRKRIG